MNDNFIGKLFISNNISIYDNEMMQYVYFSKFAARGKVSKEQELDFPDLNKDNYKIKLVCNDEFERGSLLRIRSISNESKSIYVDKVKENIEVHNTPVMVFLIQTIGVDENARYEFIASPGISLVMVIEDVFKQSRFYGIVALVTDPRTVLRGRDLVSGAEIEWILEYTCAKDLNLVSTTDRNTKIVRDLYKLDV